MKLKNSKIYTYVVYILIYLFFASTLFLALAQHFRVGRIYISDNITHINFSINNMGSTYSLYHLIVQEIWKRCQNFNYIFIIASMLIFTANVVSFMITYKYIIKHMGEGFSKNKRLLLTLSLFLVSMIVIDFSSDAYWYIGQGTPNPWHIVTFTLQKPFSLIAFSLLIDINDKLNKDKKIILELILFAIALVISASLKPSFYFVFMPGAFIFYLIKLIKSRFKIFKQCFLLGLSVVPAGLVLIFQNSILFGSTSDNKIAISFVGEVWNYFAIYNCVPLSIVLGMAFPIFVTFVYIKKLDDAYKISVITCIVGMLQAFFMIEEGHRMYDANFFWSYYCGMMLMFLVSAVTFFRDRNKGKYIRVIGTILFMAHLVCGILYYLRILMGKNYL